jgi:ABC-type multidrug transport system ATPase subunit
MKVAVNGFDVNSSRQQQSTIYRAQSFVSDLYVREYLAFNADVYKVANPHRRSDLPTFKHRKS